MREVNDRPVSALQFEFEVGVVHVDCAKRATGLREAQRRSLRRAQRVRSTAKLSVIAQGPGLFASRECFVPKCGVAILADPQFEHCHDDVGISLQDC